MGWRFRKSIKVLPGIRVNVGSKGVTSLSVGGRGMRVNIGKRGTTTTYSLFGTGLSYQTRTPHAASGKAGRKIGAAQQASSQPLPLPAPQTGKGSRGTYILVGLAALITYAVLRPESFPAPPNTTALPSHGQLAETRHPTSGSIPSVAAPAAAAPSRVIQPVGLSNSVVLGEAIATTGANVRSAASMSGSVIQVLKGGTRVRILNQEGNWRRVADLNGEPLGWVHASILRQATP